MAPTPITPPAPTFLYTFFIIALWYSSNIGVLLLNKYLLSNKDASFHYPILLTFCHMAASFLIGGVVALTNVLPFKAIKSRVQGIKVKLHVCPGLRTLSSGEGGRGHGQRVPWLAWLHPCVVAKGHKALLVGMAQGRVLSLRQLLCCTFGTIAACPVSTAHTPHPYRWSSWLASFA